MQNIKISTMMKYIFIILFSVTFFSANSQISYTTKNPTTCGLNGEIQLQVNGCFPPYSYSCSDGTTKNHLKNLIEASIQFLLQIILVVKL